MRIFLAVLFAAASAACGTNDQTSTTSSAIEQELPVEETVPASAAGTSTESGPGVPDDFSGVVTESIPISARELASIQAAAVLQAKRNPPTKKATDVGFGANSEAAPVQSAVVP